MIKTTVSEILNTAVLFVKTAFAKIGRSTSHFAKKTAGGAKQLGSFIGKYAFVFSVFSVIGIAVLVFKHSIAKQG